MFEAAEDFIDIDTEVENLEVYWIESVGALRVELGTLELLIFLLFDEDDKFYGMI